MSRPSGRVLALSSLGLLAADLIALQVHVFPTVKRMAADAGLPGSVGSMVRVLRENPGPSLWGPPILLALVIAAVVVIQWRTGEPSGWLRETTGAPRGAFALMLVAVLVGVRYYLDPGLPHQYDAKLHYMRVAQTARLLGDGAWPDWTFASYGGFPLLRFSGPLFYVLSGVAALAVDSVAVGIKLVLALAHVGSAAAVFALVRRVGGSARAAFLGGLGAAVSFQHTSSVVLAGREPVALLYVFFPLLLLAGDSLARRVSLRAIIGFGLAAGGLVLSHPGLAPYGVLSGCIFTVLRALGGRSGRGLVVTAGALVPAGIVCATVCAGLVIPALAERSEVHIANMYTTTGFAIDPTPDLGQIARLGAWNMLWSGKSVTYAGLTLIALFLLALVRRGPPRGVRLALGGTAAVLVFLVGGGYLSSRCAHFLVPVLAVGVGLAVDTLAPRRFALVVLLVLVDLGPGTFQSPFRPDLDGDVAFVHRAADASGGHRAVRVSVRNGRHAVSEWASVYDAPLAIPSGPFREAASAETYPWILGLLRSLEADLESGDGVGDGTRFGLRSLDCRWLLFEDGASPFVPDPPAGGGFRVVAEIPALEMPAASPVLGVLDATAIESLRTLAPGDWTAALAAAPAALRDGAGATVEAFRADDRTLTFDCAVEVPGRLVLSVARLPGVTVRIDDEPAELLPGPFGLVSVDVAPGPHRIVASFLPTETLRTWRLASLVAAAVFLALLAGLRRRR